MRLAAILGTYAGSAGMTSRIGTRHHLPFKLCLVVDERPQAFGRVVPLRRDLVEVPLGSIQALAVQVPDPLTPPAGVAHEPRVAESVEVARNRLTRHSGSFTETSNR